METNTLYQNDTSFSEPVNDYIYDLSTLFDQSFETNVQYTNLTIDNNVHELSTENNVHDSTCSSMSAQSMLNLGLGKKGFVVTCWERADLLALVCGVFCEFVTFPLVSWVWCGT